MPDQASSTATILQFPLANRLTQADIVQVNRWAANAERKGWFLRDAMQPRSGDATWIGCTPEGNDCFSVAYSHPGNALYYSITRRRGRWLLCNPHGEPAGEFRALQSALDVICPPPSEAA